MNAKSSYKSNMCVLFGRMTNVSDVTSNLVNDRCVLYKNGKFNIDYCFRGIFSNANSFVTSLPIIGNNSDFYDLNKIFYHQKDDGMDIEMYVVK